MTSELTVNRERAGIEAYLKTSAREGGAKKGDIVVFREREFEGTNKVVENKHIYRKEDDNDKFSRDEVNTLSEQAGGRSNFSNALKRAVKWGAASSLVFGSVRGLMGAVDTIKDTETAMARLKMVMNPVKTNFDDLSTSAMKFAKTYGTSIDTVFNSMKTFAQQGLPQEAIMDRTRTSVLAENVTDLNTNDATEALTALCRYLILKVLNR